MIIVVTTNGGGMEGWGRVIHVRVWVGAGVIYFLFFVIFELFLIVLP